METIRGFVVKKKKGIFHWEALLEEWLLVNERYCRVMSEDAPFIYTERAAVGTLAGAAWRCGRVSLEEFQCEKGHKNKPKWSGRADLYMASEQHAEQIEAKYQWVSLSSKNISSAANKVLNSAVQDARKTKGSITDLLAIGVAFLPFYLPKNKSEKLEILINSAIQEITDNVGFHAAAWCFPKEFRNNLSNTENYRPGIIMLAANEKYA